jgi:PAS domain S-box-containing protein
MPKRSTPTAVRVATSVASNGVQAAPRVTECATDHFVQFYERDEFLVSSVGRYVLDGLVMDGSAIVIGTPEHRDGIASHLKAAGIDLDSLIESGRYVPLDARETLNLLLVDGVPNRERFDRHVGALVAKLTAGSRRLCAFGEMVALLWAEGKTEAAMQLEEFWNALGERHTFSLFCAYPIKGFASSSSRQPFLHVCQAHSRVLPAEGYSDPAMSDGDRLRVISELQQKAATLESEIAERKQAEALLRRREAELRSFLDTAALGLHSVDASGVILWANKAELEMLGYDAAEYVGRPISDFHADQDVIDDIMGRLCRGEKLTGYEARLRCKDGTLKTVIIDSSVLWDEGRFVHTQCFTRDVTEQRQAEQLTRHLASIVASSDDAIFSKNLNGIVTSWNAAAERIFGYTADEIIGRSITLLIPPERLGEEVTILSRLGRGERIDHFETVRQRKDGTRLDVSVTISPVKNARGKVIGASKIARDITRRRNARKRPSKPRVSNSRGQTRSSTAACRSARPRCARRSRRWRNSPIRFPTICGRRCAACRSTARHCSKITATGSTARHGTASRALRRMPRVSTEWSRTFSRLAGSAGANCSWNGWSSTSWFAK